LPRLPRNILPGIPLHIIQRGNNRQCCFFAQRDFIVYLDKLDEYSKKFNVAVHGFVLMTNHVHLLLTPANASGASQLLQALGRYYVRYINSTWKRTGTLWEGRFKASLVDSERYFLTVSRYIELNPVRAGMVKHPAEYTWSSYRMNALGKDIRLLTPHPVYLALGQSAEERQRAYQALFTSLIPDYTINEIRTAANKAWVLGDDRFKLQIERQLGHQVPPFRQGGDRKSNEYTKERIKLL
jgi:putative transposase